MTPEEMDRLLNEPFYSWDVSHLLGGIVDFLKFSEGNLYWQRAREIRKAKQEAEAIEFEPEDAHLLPQARGQIVEAAEYRFNVGLSQRVRYAGLIAYVTSVEWCSRLFEARLSTPRPTKPKQMNEAVHTLQHLNGKVGQQFVHEIETFRQAVIVRNCVVHSAGLVKDDRCEKEIREAIGVVEGFGLSKENFIGETVHINEGAVESLARSALIWVPSIDKRCSSNGAFTKHP